VSFFWREKQLVIPMGGKFTLMNALAAVTAADVLHVSHAAIAKGCSSLAPVPGRFESVKNDLDIGVIVDYAHTPEGLSEVLATARELTTGDVLVVFGCGGNRDHGKRPMMGEIAARMANKVFVTSDNPRNEDPQMIVNEILSGVNEPQRSAVHVDIDRSAAITSAISAAERGDIVVIAGKGHETTQEINGVLSPFSDVDVATQALQTRKGIAS
jgi:UDP-N-acetylmuramoyl-L-alanyl-D-glutamate--2,6-diaminopimelate ligase